MKCNCLSTNKYEIVGLCDIQKFNEKIESFEDKSWTQVVISDNLILLGKKPSIKNIVKTFIDVKITSTKLINTPKSEETNVEGLKLTGKLLLITGEINQRILYISNCSNSDKINSFKIKAPFTTYIVVDKNVDISQDKFCIYPCLEYASIRPINECTLSQNVTLFLFAHKTKELIELCPQPPVISPYPNEIIFKNDNGEELARIKFNKENNVLEVTSTGSIQTGSREVVLEFELFNSDGVTRKELGQIIGNQNANQFVNSLNNKAFNYSDVIKISYFRHPSRVQITNYPTDGQNYNPTEISMENFRIENNRLSKINP